jgi:hypothetical protein
MKSLQATNLQIYTNLLILLIGILVWIRILQ